MKKKLLSLLLGLILTFSLLPSVALAATPAVDTDQSTYAAGATVNVLLSSNKDLMIEVFRGDSATGIKLISSATSEKTYSFKTATDWSTGTYTVVVGAGSNRASCTFTLLSSSAESPPSARYVYLTVYGPNSALLSNKRIDYSSGMSAYATIKDYSGLSVTSGWSNSFGTYYVSAISGYAEYDYGSMSGWMYSVNGTTPNVGASSYTLSAGDNLLWFYTKNGSSAMYNPSSSELTTQVILTTGSTGELTLTAEKLANIITSGQGVSVGSAAGNVSLTADGTKVLSKKLGSNEKLNIEVAKTNAAESRFAVVSNSKTIAALDISITAGSSKITNGFGTMTINIPVGIAYKNQTLSILHLKNDGSYEILTGSVDASGVLSFDTDSLSTFVVMAKSDIPVEYLFSDVKADDWYAKCIQYVWEKGLMSGTSGTTFEPQTVMTRSMLVTVLYRMAGSPSVAGTSNYKDVTDENAWYHHSVIWASKNHIVNGYGDGYFGTNNNLTREELFTIFYRYAKYKGYDISAGKDTNILSYTDALAISDWAFPAFQWAIGSRIATGTSATTLSPAGNGTRCEVATLITRFESGITA